MFAAEALPEMVELGEETLSEVGGALGGEGAHPLLSSMGLTEAENYRGFFPLGLLAYRYLYPPLKLLYTIEQQVAGTLDALYNFLGGVGQAAGGAVQAVESAGATAWQDIVNAGTTVENAAGATWGWLTHW